MTTVAWDGHILAVDRGGWCNGMVTQHSKIRTVTVINDNPWGGPGDKLMVAMFGWLSLMDNTCAHVAGDAELRAMEMCDSDHVVAVVVNKKREVWQLSATGMRTLIGCCRADPEKLALPLHHFPERPDYFAAWATGGAFATGALAAGCTAIEAVQLANRFTDCDKYGVDFLSWKEVFGPYPESIYDGFGEQDYNVRSSDEAANASNKA